MPDGVAFKAASAATMDLLAEHGYTVVPVETTEFLKPGGSVDRLSLRLP